MCKPTRIDLEKSSFARRTMVAAALVGCLAVPVVAQDAPTQVFDWRMAGKQATTHFSSVLAFELADLVKERTNGGLNITYYPGATLVKNDEQAADLVRGTIELSMDTPAYQERLIPEMGIIANPFAGLPAEAWREQLKPGASIRAELDKALEERGVKMLAIWPSGDLGYASYGPLRTVEDFSGVKIRGSAEGELTVLRDIGAAVVSLSGSEAAEGMRQNVIEASVVPPPSFVARGYADFAKYFNNWHVAIIWDNLTVNKQYFDQLPPEYQQVLVDAAAEINEKGWIEAVAADDRAFSEMTAKGVEIVEIDQEQLNRIAEIADEKVWAEWAERTGESGELMLGILQTARSE